GAVARDAHPAARVPRIGRPGVVSGAVLEVGPAGSLDHDHVQADPRDPDDGDGLAFAEVDDEWLPRRWDGRMPENLVELRSKLVLRPVRGEAGSPQQPSEISGDADRTGKTQDTERCEDRTGTRSSGDGPARERSCAGEDV